MAKAKAEASADDTRESFVPVARNKRARFKYELFDKFEAGLVLCGTEVKSLRSGKASINEAFVSTRGHEIFVIGMNIPHYEQGNRENHDPTRTRKLLMHKREIKRLIGRIHEKGFTLIPLSLYFRRGRAKLQIALAKGKRVYDRRESIKKREASRDMDRAARRRR